MADQQRKVSLIFEANANQAKNEINSLVQSLQKIQSMPRSLIDPTGIKEASRAAMELQGHIQKAINTDTGKLDLSRFATSLKASGRDLDYFRSTLTSIGPEGNAAFQGMIRGINNAQVSTVRLTKGMQNFLTTMKNTVKWQISSSLMHGAISSIQQAIGYAKALDASLTSIRIVTGQSSEQMARFAVEANRAAQALNTTTTKYTDAALIFYQQGLGDKAVKERTEAVIKMANVTGEAAADVSSYMTAIWNNFADGTKALEYYEDVITKLGASTAASSKEIAGGLEKFAAIGNTIGLSYEYATSMIATIVDKTRQSEDVVGTALKTILARIQGLNLGETLEDGTTLNKYSQALANVGVNIKDASGQLKDMDAILDELGAKWGTLSKDTQVALAQVVGGVRQYNQIISLMDHWGSFKNNVNLAETSAGTLEEQADIYAESWEAARNRVKAAAEGIYDSLLDEKVFIQLDNLFTGLLNTIGGVVKGMGGMIPILATIGGFMTQRYAKEMPVLLGNIAQNFSALTGKSNNNAAELQKEATRQAGLAREASVLDPQAEAQYASLERVSKMREHLIINQRSLNSVEREELEMLIQNEQAVGDIMSQRAQSLKLVEQETEKIKEQIALQATQAQVKAEGKLDYTKSAEEGDKTSPYWDKIRQGEQRAFRRELQKGNKEIAALEDKPYRNAMEQDRLLALKSQRATYGTGRGELNEAALLEARRRAEASYIKEVKSTESKYIDLQAQNKQKSILKNEFGDFLKSDNLKNTENQVEALRTKFKALKDSMTLIGEDDSSLQSLDQAIKNLGNSTDLTEDQIKALQQALDGIDDKGGPALEAVKQKMKELGIDSKENLDKLDKAGGALGAGKMRNDRTPVGQLPTHKTGTAEVMASTASTLMSVYGTLNSLISLNTVLMDENASGLQKAGAIMGAVASIMMTANSVMSFANTLKTIESVKLKQGITFKIANIAATKATTAAEGTLTATIWKQIAAWTAWMATNPIGWVLAIGAAVAGLAIALKSIDWRSEEQKKIDDLTEKVKALDKAQQNLAQHISDVESAWDGYQDAVDALEACTTGTEEWNQALLKCNESVLSLLALTPELAQFVQYNEDGSISLGGVGFEEYLADRKRENAALQAQKTIANAEIKKLELSSNIYGDSKTNAEVSKYFSSAEGKNNLSGLESDAMALQRILDDVGAIYGPEQAEEAASYLIDSNIVNASFRTAIESYFRNGVFDSFLGDLGQIWSNSLYNYEDVDPYKVNQEWATNLTQYEGYLKTQEAANHTLLSSLTDYEQDNLGLYGDLLSNNIRDKQQEYSGKDTKDLKQLMVDTFGGEADDYKEMSAEEMSYVLAVQNVTSNLGTMNGIISSVNASLNGLSDAGKSLARTGTLAGVALRDTAELYVRGVPEGYSQTSSLTKWSNIEDWSSMPNWDPTSYVWDKTNPIRNDTLNNYIKANNSKAQMEFLEENANAYQNDYAAYNRALGIGRLNNINNAIDSIIALQDLEIPEEKISPLAMSEYLYYDELRAGLAEGKYSEKGGLFGLFDSEYETRSAELKRLEEKYGAEFLQARPQMSWQAASDARTTFTDMGMGMAYDPGNEDATIGLLAQEGYMININNALEAIGDQRRINAETTEEELNAILADLQAEQVDLNSMLQIEDGGIAIDVRKPGFYESGLTAAEKEAEKLGLTQQDLLNYTSGEEFNPIKNYFEKFFGSQSEEMYQKYLEVGAENFELEEYMPIEGYKNWVNDVKESLGQNFNSILSEFGDEAIALFEGDDYLAQTEFLQDNAFEINSILNKAQEDIAKRVLDIEEGANLFEQALGDKATGNYATDWNAVMAMAQEKNPENWNREQMLAATGKEAADYSETAESAKQFAYDLKLITEEQFKDPNLEINWEKVSELFNQAIEDNLEAGLTALNKIQSNRFKSNYEVKDGKYELKEGTTATPLDNLFDLFRGSGATIGDIDAFATSFNGIVEGITEAEFGDMSQLMSEMIANGEDAPTAIKAFKELAEIYQSTGDITLEDISKVAKDNDMSIQTFGGSLESLADIIESSGASANTAATNFEKLLGILSGTKDLAELTTGEEISKEDYDQYEQYLGDYKDKFIRSADGYMYIGTEEEAEQMAGHVRGSAFEGYYNDRQEKQAAGEDAFIDESAWFQDGATPENLTTDNMLRFLMSSSFGLNNTATQDFLKAAGIDEAQIQAVQNAEANGLIGYNSENKMYEVSNEADAETQGAVAAMIDAIASYLKGDFEGKTTEEAQVELSSLQSTEDLYNAIANGDIQIGNEEGQISQEQYDAVESSLLDKKATGLGFDVEEIEEYAKYLKETNEEYKDFTDNQLKNAAIAAKRLQRGVKQLNEEWEDNKKILEDSNASEEEKFEALQDTQEALEDIYDMDLDDLNMSEFMDEETKKLVDTINEGGEEAEDAMLQLGQKIAESKGLYGENAEALEVPLEIDVNGDGALDTVRVLRDQIIGELSDMTPGPINDANILQSLSTLVNSCATSVDHANAILSSMGIEATVKEVEVGEGQTVKRSITTATGSITASLLDGSSVDLVGNPTGELLMEEQVKPGKFYTIEGANYTGGGIKNGGSRGSGGGGGGGGGGGRRAPRAEKKKDAEKDRYHTIKNVLEDLTAAYDKISTAKDRAFGKSRVKQMEEEEAALQGLISAQQSYLDEALAYLDSDMEALSSLSEMSGVALQFDENGTLLNFEDLQNAMYDLYNSHINENGEADMNEEDWKKFEEQWEEQMALLEQYEETQDLVNELRQQLQYYINQIYDLRLEKVTYMVEVDIEASDDALEILDYMLGKIEDDAWSAAEAIAYMGDQVATMLDQTNTYTSGIRDILMNHTQAITDSNGNVVHAADLTVADVEAFMAGDAAALNKIMGMGDNFTADEVEALRDYHMQLIQMNESLREVREQMHQTVLDAFEQFNEELDRSISKIDHLTSVTEHYRNIVDILGKQNLGISNEMLLAAGQVNVQQGIDRVTATRTKKETLEAEIEQAQQALENARANGWEEDVKMWEKSLREMRDALDEAEEDFLQSWEDALTAINEQFELSITQAIETFSDKMAGPLMGSLEQLQEAFERQSTLSELYLPNYEKIYELNKLNRDILNSIDDTDNIKGKQELAALQAEINALEAEGVEVSRYQTEDLRRRYELKLAEIALSDAQNAKSQVQMARGADGNWSYVYTASEEDVAAAEQNYEDKLFAIQQANAEYINEMQDSLIQAEVEMMGRIEEIWNDETLSMEEKMARVNELTEYYTELFNYYSGQLTLGLENNSQDFHDTALATLTGFETIQDYQQNLNDAIGNPEEGGMLFELAEAYRIWAESVEEAMAAADTSTDEYADAMAEAVNAAAEASTDAAEQIVEDGENIVETFEDIIDAVETWEQAYSDTIDNMLAQNEALAQSFNQILQAWSDYTDATTADAEEEPTAAAPGDSGGETEGGEEEEEAKDPVAKAHKYKKGIAFAIWHYPGGAGWGRGSERFRNFRKAGMDDKIVQAQVNAYRGWRSGRMAADSGIGSDKASLKPYTRKHFAFDTGGYTGAWGEDGRWALLHQKEIVLNKDDTTNLLSAVDMIRQIAKVIDLNAYSSAGFGSSILTAGSGSAGQFEQNVHITAEFPNATNREEIYAAFNDIVNLASQYANR